MVRSDMPAEHWVEYMRKTAVRSCDSVLSPQAARTVVESLRAMHVQVERLTERLRETDDVRDTLASQGDALRAEVAELKDKAIRFDLDQAGIAQRDAEAVELVELRAEVAEVREQRDASRMLFELTCASNEGLRTKLAAARDALREVVGLEDPATARCDLSSTRGEWAGPAAIRIARAALAATEDEAPIEPLPAPPDHPLMAALRNGAMWREAEASVRLSQDPNCQTFAIEDATEDEA